MPELDSSKPVGRLPKRPARLLLELFVALSLCVNFFYLVKAQCLPKKRDSNMLPAVTFCWLAENFNIPATTVPQFWRTRVLAPLMSSRLTQTKFDYPVDFRSSQCKNLLEVSQTTDFQNLFGFYHASWLFLTFVLLIWLRPDALLLILGVFAGLMYNLIEPAGMYYYPWDMPVMFFFTLACLLFDRGRIWALLPVIWVGGLIKETTLCCALFVLLGSHWNWPKRIAGFVTVVVVTLATNRLLLAHFGVQAPLFTMNNAGNVTDLVQHTMLLGSVASLFSLHLDHVIFANAGALFLMMFIPWQNRRDVLFKLLIVMFAFGQFLYGYLNEFRIWYELLPLGWILISEAVTRSGEPVAAPEPARRVWTVSYWLALGALFAMGLVLLVIAKRTLPPPPVETRSEEEILREKVAQAEAGDVALQFELGRMYQNRSETDEAIPWYRRAAEAGHQGAQFDLGLIYFGIRHDYVSAEQWLHRAADSGHPAAQYYEGIICANGLAGHQDYPTAIVWLQKAAFQAEMHAQFSLGQIYELTNTPVFDLIEAYKWLKVAQLQGVNEAPAELAACTAKMSPAQIAEGEARLKQLITPQKQ